MLGTTPTVPGWLCIVPTMSRCCPILYQQCPVVALYCTHNVQLLPCIVPIMSSFCPVLYQQCPAAALYCTNSVQLLPCIVPTVSQLLPCIVPTMSCCCRTSVLFVSISFIVLMVISLAWLVFYYVQRFRYIHAKDRLSVFNVNFLNRLIISVHENVTSLEVRRPLAASVVGLSWVVRTVLTIVALVQGEQDCARGREACTCLVSTCWKDLPITWFRIYFKEVSPRVGKSTLEKLTGSPYCYRCRL
uniref:Uncharacterized protein n=1 Tax=Timema genevievae TaxID=629358 RepID=A0A7R9K5L1_TIMGE|nr:unnamed protein product [Timema genevievae]